MKKIALLLLAMIICSVTFSQNDDKEILGTYRYIRLPKAPLPSEFKTYRVDVNCSNLYLRDDAYSKINIQGFKKIDSKVSEVGDFSIKIEVYPFEFSGIETYSYQTSQKVDGVEKKINKFGYKGAVRYKIELIMIDKNDSIYYKKEISDVAKWDNSNYNSQKEANDNSASHRNNLPSSIVSSFINGHNNAMNDQFGFVPKQLVPLNYTVKVSKKCKFDYSDLISSSELFKTTFEVLAKDEKNVEAFKAGIEPAIQKWSNALTESDIKNKKARINKDLTCALYHNLGTAYFLLKDYNKAIENFEKCREIKKSYGYASEYIGLSKDLNERLLVNTLL